MMISSVGCLRGSLLGARSMRVRVFSLCAILYPAVSSSGLIRIRLSSIILARTSRQPLILKTHRGSGQHGVRGWHRQRHQITGSTNSISPFFRTTSAASTRSSSMPGCCFLALCRVSPLLVPGPTALPAFMCPTYRAPGRSLQEPFLAPPRRAVPPKTAVAAVPITLPTEGTAGMGQPKTKEILKWHKAITPQLHDQLHSRRRRAAELAPHRRGLARTKNGKGSAHGAIIVPMAAIRTGSVRIAVRRTRSQQDDQA